MSAIREIADRLEGKVAASILQGDEDGPTVHYYAEIPMKAASTAEWLAGNPVAAQRNPKADDDKPIH